MINTSKLYAVWGTALKRDKFRAATLELTFFYVLSTAAILFVSSVAILILFTPPEATLPFQAEGIVVEAEHGEWSVYELREHLLTVVIIVDLSILIVISMLSYSVAKRTLLPIKHMHETQQRFMSDVAHELRTPLSVILAGSDTLLRKERVNDEYKEFVSDVQEEAGRLTRLSNQLLQLLKTGTVAEVIRTEENVSKLIETEARRFTPYAHDHGVTMVSTIAPAITVYTERDGLIEVIQNVLKNAIDYNKEGGEVIVSLMENSDAVTIEIKDTGIGISPEAQAVVFNRFAKGDAARTQTAGSGAGLGLSIVLAIVTKLGGQLRLTSTPTVGTTVSIVLPKYLH